MLSVVNILTSALLVSILPLHHSGHAIEVSIVVVCAHHVWSV